ncbi:PBECR4 domain-containing protein [Companilactobacillus sp. DQM5]|uniref:PBECR4 domain-containing protein n=1 Tax=Companilactobacillus sp. DQM5 TaxID=3463359 RepID=UPI004058DFAA
MENQFDKEVPIIIDKENDIDFYRILVDYRNFFSGRSIKITTNYNLLSTFIVSFNDNDLPHLMGWHKLRNSRATKLISAVESGSLTKEKVKRHPKWHEASQRMLSYNFMHRIFVDQDISAFVYTREMKPNRQNLDIVFLNNRKKDTVILGLRKANGRDTFIPTTLHVEPLNNSYNGRRRTRIKSTEWL